MKNKNNFLLLLMHPVPLKMWGDVSYQTPPFNSIFASSLTILSPLVVLDDISNHLRFGLHLLLYTGTFITMNNLLGYIFIIYNSVYNTETSNEQCDAGDHLETPADLEAYR